MVRVGCKHSAVDTWALQGPTGIGAPQMPNESQVRSGGGAEGSDATRRKVHEGDPLPGLTLCQAGS